MDRKSQLSLTGNEWREEKNWTRILPTMRGSKSSTKGKKKRRRKWEAGDERCRPR
jgi:hypothetical protein